MTSIPWALAGAAALLVGHGAEAAPATSASLIEAFQAICATGDPTPATTLARADQRGWRRSGSDAPQDFNPASQRLSPAAPETLLLTTDTETTTTQSVDSCGVSAPAPVADLLEATQAWIGVAPVFAMAGSAAFSAVRVDGAWRPAAGLARPILEAAQREGRLFSVMVLDSQGGIPGGRATLALLRAEPRR